MTGGQRAGLDHRLDAIRQPQQAQRIGEVRSALADDVGECLLRVLESLDQVAIAARLLDRIEVRPLHVFDQRDLEQLLVVELPHNDGNRMQPGLLRRAPAPLAGNDLEARLARPRRRPDDQWLDQSLLADGACELVELVRLEILARIQAARPHLMDRHGLRLAFGRDFRSPDHRLAHQGLQASAEAARWQCGAHWWLAPWTFFKRLSGLAQAAAYWRSRSMISVASLMYAWLPAQVWS